MDEIIFKIGHKIPEIMIYKNQALFCFWAKAEMDIDAVVNLLSILEKWDDYKNIMLSSSTPIESMGVGITGSVNRGTIFVNFFKNKIEISTSIYKYNDSKSGGSSFEINDELHYENVILALKFAEKYKKNNFSFTVCDNSNEVSEEQPWLG